MYYKEYIKGKKTWEAGQAQEQEFMEAAIDYVQPVMDRLGEQLDKRLTYTVFDSFMGMLHFRDRANGLLLSELGGYINGPEHAPAGTKRLSNLLRDEHWSHEDIQAELLNKVQTKLAEPGKEGKRWLMHWDDSMIEKPESLKLEGLCPVHSSKGARLTRIKPGFYRPPSRIYVPGFEWSAGVLSSASDRPLIASMRWWTTRGKHRDQRCNILYRMLQQSTAMIKQTQAEVWHVFDRGYANRTTLDYMLEHFQSLFIVRWKSNHQLLNEKDILKKTFQHSLGKPATSTRWVWDKQRKERRRVKLLYLPVREPEFAEHPLYLVIVRDPIKGRKPIYLLTSVPVDTNGMALAVLRAYMKRWDVERIFRFGKSGMAMQSPRLWFWENRLKLLMLVTLVMAFILTMLFERIRTCRAWIKRWCPRTGRRQKRTFLPLYRLRAAIALLINYKLVPT